MKTERQRIAMIESNARGELATEETPQTRASIRVLRFQSVRERTGLSRTTVWRLERRGAFPRHRRISLNAVGWLEHEVDAWISSRE